MKKFSKIVYKKLTAVQQENYNFQKISALLADYGFSTIRLSDDWQGADFIANHVNGETYIKVQLKGRFTIAKKYIEKDIWICFPFKAGWYFYPHDTVMNELKKYSNFENTESWKRGGVIHNANPSKKDFEMLSPYKL